MINDFVGQDVLIQTLTHDGRYELVAGTLEYYHAQSRQIYIKDFTIWTCEAGKLEKLPLYSGELCMLVEKSVFVLMKRPKKLQKIINVKMGD